MKFLRLALSPGAEPGEVSASAVRFIESLRHRGIEAEAFEALLEEIPEPDAPVLDLEPVAEPILSHFQAACEYVLGVRAGPSPEHQFVPEFAWLHQQFRQQAASVMGGRI
jgi:hypothetical protein